MMGSMLPVQMSVLCVRGLFRSEMRGSLSHLKYCKRVTTYRRNIHTQTQHRVLVFLLSDYSTDSIAFSIVDIVIYLHLSFNAA